MDTYLKQREMLIKQRRGNNKLRTLKVYERIHEPLGWERLKLVFLSSSSDSDFLCQINVSSALSVLLTGKNAQLEWMACRIFKWRVLFGKSKRTIATYVTEADVRG